MIPAQSKLDRVVENYLDLYGKVPAEELCSRIAGAVGLSEEDSGHALGIILLNIEEAKAIIKRSYLKPEFSQDACRRKFAVSATSVSQGSAFKLFDHALAWVTK